MDMSSFPQMLKFKQKIIPNPQLLRWAEWFSKYSFDCKHIKGKSNTLADFLTRPTSIPKAHNQEIMMFKSSSSKPSKKNKSTQETTFDIPPNLNPDFPPEVYRLVLENQFHPRARAMIFEYQLNLFQEFGGLMLKPFGLHPDYPFIHPIFFEFTEIPDELKWLLWYFTHCYHIAVQFVLEDLQYFIDQALNKTMEPHLQNFITIFQWFYPLHQWKEMISKESENKSGSHIIIILYKPQCFVQCGNSKQMGTFPSAWIHRILPEDVRRLRPHSASKIVESSTTAEEEYDKTVRSLKRMQVEKMDTKEKFEALQLEIWRRKRQKEERIVELNITDDESINYKDLL
ncbi:hypothetical protein V6N11_072624 [Hibiscus sabdariffa]|uniref:Reverse transcriptase RNase H-like domain-containing protein n=1 Tax=Hibiscus sabdariffa TaxID=183260 RepID=A0ABR2U3M8_9ROSI